MLLLQIDLDQADGEAGEEETAIRGWLLPQCVHIPHKGFCPLLCQKAKGIEEGARGEKMVSFLVDPQN